MTRPSQRTSENCSDDYVVPLGQERDEAPPDAPVLANGTPSASGIRDGSPVPSGDVYTLSEAARLKGVSYHTVSRAVRRGALAAHRLGRMALVSADDLRAWQPMRERAPHRYRQRTPDPLVTPALLDRGPGTQTSGVTAVLDLLQGPTTQLALSDLLAVIARRITQTIGMTGVGFWVLGESGRTLERVSGYGDPISHLPEHARLADVAIFGRILAQQAPEVIHDLNETGGTNTTTFLPNVQALLGAPLRADGRLLGCVIGWRDGREFQADESQLGVAELLIAVAGGAIERQRARSGETTRRYQMRELIERIPGPVAATDPMGKVIAANAAFRAIAGISATVATSNPDLIGVLTSSQTPDAVKIGRSVIATAVNAALRGEDARQLTLTCNGLGDVQRVHVTFERLGTGLGGSSDGLLVRLRDNALQGPSAVPSDGLGTASPTIPGDRASVIADVALAMNSTASLDEVLDIAIERLTVSLGGYSGAIFFRDPDGRMVGQAGYRFDDPPAREVTIEPDAVPATSAALAHRSPVFYTYAEASASERAFFDHYHFRSATIAPLIVHDEILGVAYVNFADETYRPNGDDLPFTAALAGQCAAAINKARLIERWERAHRRLLAVVDQLPQGVVIVQQPAGQLVLANRAAEELWGVTLTGLAEIEANALPATADDRSGPNLDRQDHRPEHEARYDSLTTLLPLADSDGVPFAAGEAPIERTLRTGERRLGEPLTIPRDDGTIITIVANHAPVLDTQGRIIGAVGVLQDVAELRELDRAKDEFLSVVAHELRNPLTSLRGNMQLLLRRLRRQGDPARDDEIVRLESLIGQSDRMGELVNRLLDVSRADLGRLELSLTSGDATPLIQQSISTAAGLIKRHKIIADIPEHCTVVWDAIRIEQVLDNLLSNAIKYAPDGEIRVRLSALPDDQLQISVEDHGPGIPDAAKARLFERYFRANQDPTLGMTGEGLGIGLYISHKIAAAHGGTLTVADAPGGGSIFTLTLPREATVVVAPGSSAVPEQPDSAKVVITNE